VLRVDLVLDTKRNTHYWDVTYCKIFINFFVFIFASSHFFALSCVYITNSRLKKIVILILPSFLSYFLLGFLPNLSFLSFFNVFLFCLEVLLAVHIHLFLFVFLPFLVGESTWNFWGQSGIVKGFATGNLVLPF